MTELRTPEDYVARIDELKAEVAELYERVHLQAQNYDELQEAKAELERLRPKTFTYNGVTLPLLDHPYNTTAKNERAVEVPIAFDWVSRQTGRGLEVGNVLQHYAPVKHAIVDLYEKGDSVHNVDLFTITQSYDWVVSISTIEHVRWDKDSNTNNPYAAIAALHYLRGLAPNVFVTIPYGQHPELDRWLLRGSSAGFHSTTTVRDATGWHQTDLPQFVDPDSQGCRTVWIGTTHE